MATRIERPSAPVTTSREARQRGSRVDVGRGSRGRSRLSEIVVGVAVVAACALGVVLWHRSATTTQDVLVLSRTVRAGEELRADAVRAEPVHVGAGVSHVAVSDASRVIGKAAAVDLTAGTLVSEELFRGRPPVPTGSTVVAAALVPGQFATFQLRPGQTVAALRTGGASGTAPADAAVLATATVYEIRVLDDTAGTWVVSLLVPEDAAPAVASAATAKSLSLALTTAATP